METIKTIVAAIGTVFTSGGVGLIGLAIQRYFDHKKFEADVDNKKNERAHELAMKRADAEYMREETAALIRIAEVNGEAQMNVSADNAFSASFKTEPTSYVEKIALSRGQTWVMVYLEGLRGSIRPLLTIYMCVLTTLILSGSFYTMMTSGLGVNPAFAERIFEEAVTTVLGLFVTVSTWWFGSRNRGKAPSLGK